MNLTINGELVTVEESIKTITDLLGFFKLQDKVVIVETNGLIVERTSHDETNLSDGDKIEIVHFVGGG